MAMAGFRMPPDREKYASRADRMHQNPLSIKASDRYPKMIAEPGVEGQRRGYESRRAHNRKTGVMFSGPLSSRWRASLKKLTSKLSEVKQNPASVRLVARCLSGSGVLFVREFVLRSDRVVGARLVHKRRLGRRPPESATPGLPGSRRPASARTEAATRTGRFVPMKITRKNAFPS